jgi:SagB-type dehydrogenase family enzyme
LANVSQLLWAAQGISDEKENKRTAPSAGALYPIELYFIAGKVKDLPSGIYKYQPDQHILIKISEKDVRSELKKAALNQDPVEDGAGVLVFTAVYERTTKKYGNRGIRYAQLETGHAAQNVYLQAVSLDLGTVVIGAFDDNKIKEIINLKDNERPLYLMPVGKK